MIFENNCTGKRISFEQSLGTIKYHGQIAGKVGMWFGVEWDSVERGKHSGSIDGRVYFEVSTQGAGSFLSTTKSIEFGKGFLDVLKDKYLGTAPSAIIDIGSTKNVETLGWDKMQLKLSKLDKLVIVGLASLLIVDEPFPDLITHACSSIQDIDLSGNLFTSLNQVAQICASMKNLEILRLNRNRFSSFTIDHICSFTNVTVLTLVSALLSWPAVQQIEIYFATLKELHLGNNSISSISNIKGFAKLEVLNLERNNIKDWNAIVEFGKLPRLKSLNLANNFIEKIKVCLNTFNSLVFLNISSNKIKTWMDIDALNSYPTLTDLRTIGNPICDSIDTTKRSSLLVARLTKVVRLEGASVSFSQRLDSECYYLNQAFLERNDTNFKSNHPRYAELCATHGSPVASKADNTVADRLIEVKLESNGMMVEKKMPKHTTIRAFKIIFARAFWPKDWRSNLGGLIIWTRDEADIEMTDELKSLDFYGVTNGDSFKFIAV